MNKEIAKVQIKPEGCGGCTACHIGSMIEQEPIEVNAFNEVKAERGDLVHVEIPGRKIIEGSAVLFMIPFIGFIAGFFIGYYPLWFLTHTSRDLVALVCGFVLLTLSYTLVRYLGGKSDFEYVVKEVLTEENEADADPASLYNETPRADNGPTPIL